MDTTARRVTPLLAGLIAGIALVPAAVRAQAPEPLRRDLLPVQQV
jgi:hypothetical protein